MGVSVNGLAIGGPAASPFTIHNGAQNAQISVDGSGNLTIDTSGALVFFNDRLNVTSSSSLAFQVGLGLVVDRVNARAAIGATVPLTSFDVANGDVTIRNGTTPTRLDLYSTRTDANNYERLSVYGQSASNFVIATEAAGTGSIRDLTIDGPSIIRLGNASATPQPREIRGQSGSGTDIAGASLILVGGRSTGTGVGGRIELRTTPAGSSGSALNTPTARLRITEDDPNSGRIFAIDSSFILDELGTAPSGLGNKAILFAEDNGAGKTRLMVQFATGAAQQIALEP